MGALSSLKSLASEESLNANNAIKIYLMNLDQIQPSENNPYGVKNENVQALAENIAEFGLSQPIKAYLNKDGTYTIISGHTRYLAMKQLLEKGMRYKYNGYDITGKAPVGLEKCSDEENKKLLQYVSANVHRDMSSEEKKAILDQVVPALKEMEKNGQIEKLEGRLAHSLSVYTGISEHFCKDYLAQKNKAMAMVDGGIADTEEEAISKIRQSKRVDEEEKQYKKLVKDIDKLSKTLHGFDPYILQTLDDADLKKLKKAVMNMYGEIGKLGM